jgi:predicted dehydrogenase
LGQTPAEVEEMARAARKAGVQAMPGLQGRAAPWVNHLKELVEQGYLGRPLTVNARLFMPHAYMRAGIPWAAKRAGGNHILTIQTAHMLDIIGYALGGFRTVAAVDSTMNPQWVLPATGETIAADAPDHVIVRGTLGSGASLSAHFAYVPAHGSGWRLEVYGERGTLVASSPGPAMVMPNRIEGGTLDDKLVKELPVPGHLVTVPPEVPADSSAFHVAHMYRRLATAIREGRTADPNFDTALQLYGLVGVLERSSQQGGAEQTIGG